MAAMVLLAGCAADSFEEEAVGTDEAAAGANVDATTLFEGGKGGYHSYRIPAIVTSRSGTLLAFAEGRKSSSKDYGNIDIVLRRSTDNGKTWSAIESIFSKDDGTCGNPTPVVDRDTDTVWLFASYNDAAHNQFGADGLKKIDSYGDRRLFTLVSRNDGRTWTDTTDRTTSLVPKGYAWDAVGPGRGIQITTGARRGRLIVPAIGRNIYSDDHGATWGVQMLPGGTSEGTIAELSNGLIRNDRASSEAFKARKRRQVSKSMDGEKWSAWQSDDELLDPICEASVLTYTQSSPHRLVFLNPSSTEKRNKMRVRISYDDGKTWPVQRLLDADRGGYSSMTKTEDFNIGALYELGGRDNDNRDIGFRKFGLKWITNGAPEPS